MENIQNEILTILLETLKEQANKYKIIVQDSTLTHEQRKEFDTEISQMYKVLADMSASSTVYTIAELQALKIQYKTKLDEFETILNNIDISNLTLTPEQIESLKGEKGENGKDFKYEDLTTQQKNELVSYFNNSFKIVALENSLQMQNENFSNHLQNYFIFLDEFNELKSRIQILENNQGSTTPPETTKPDNNSLFINIPADSNSYYYKVSYTPQIGDIIEFNATLEDGTVLKEDGSIVDYGGNLIFSSNWNYEYPADLQPLFIVAPGSNFLFINNDITDSQGNKLSISQQLEVILIRGETKIKLELLEFTTDGTISNSWWQ